MMTITEMQNAIVEKFGFEHEHTIHFFEITEYKFAKKIIHHYFDKYMAMDITDDED